MVCHQGFVKFGVLGGVTFLTKQLFRDVAAVCQGLHCLTAKDELVVEIEVDLV
jgi:hypothetical protein